jgi:A/G-specific adenine glycosylase
MLQISNDEVKFFQENILRWFNSYGRTFEWRNNNLSPYKLIIAEVLLQRTKAETVAKFYKRFLIEFPGWNDIAKVDIQALEDYLIPIGLYKQRAQRLKKLAIYMVDHNEILPLDRSELENIPFMGQYIANAVELLIHYRAKPLLDVNMARVLERFFGPRQKADIRYDPYLQALSSQVVQHDISKHINWAILDFAALVCKARNPLCDNCLLNPKCKFYNNIKTLYISNLP